MSFIKQIPLYEECPVQECKTRTGKMPISTKWVDVAKEGGVRSRWVARDFKPRGEQDRADLFAAMPPLEAKRLLFRQFAIHRNRVGRLKYKLMLIDVKKAHLNGTCEDDAVYVQLPAEAEAPGTCGRLLKWLYGMRGAASAWESDYSEKLRSIGFIQGASAPTVFFNPTSDVRCVVHGDDFTFLGPDAELKSIAEMMSEWYELKVRGILGTDEEDSRSISILNREISVTESGLVYKADSKHARMIWEQMGLTAESKGVSTPYVREENVTEDDDEVLEAEERNLFRRVAARANYLAQDRADIQFAVKEICTYMSTPTRCAMRKLKHLARYLIAQPEVEMLFRWKHEEELSRFDIFTDSDRAGCRRTRKSTSGGVITLGGGLSRVGRNLKHL